MVNESGASIYSASDVAREEFPDHDLTVRGAVSIGRRLMDPLAELVKLDPKSIGVGQYQHDVDQLALKRSLDDTVVSAVNGVGVELKRNELYRMPGRYGWDGGLGTSAYNDPANGLIGILLAGLVNMIWPSGTMSFIISVAGVLIFSGLIAYDTQKIKEQYADAWDTQASEKIAIFGALSLYLDFINLFQFLLYFMGGRRD